MSAEIETKNVNPVLEEAPPTLKVNDDFVGGLDPSLGFKLQSDDELHDNLVSSYTSLSLVSALFLTMIYAFADGPPEAIEDSMWGEYTDEVVNVAGIMNGLAVVANLGCTFDCVLLLLRLSEIPADHTRAFVETYGHSFICSPYHLNNLGFWPFLIGIALNYSLVYKIWAFIAVMFFAVGYIVWYTINWNFYLEPSRAVVLEMIKKERENPKVDKKLSEWLSANKFQDLIGKFADSDLTLDMLKETATKDSNASPLLNEIFKDIKIDSPGQRLKLILALQR